MKQRMMFVRLTTVVLMINLGALASVSSAVMKKDSSRKKQRTDTITVAVNNSGNVSIEPDPSPDDGSAYDTNDRITWVADQNCKLKVHFMDNINPDNFPPPDCDSSEKNPCSGIAKRGQKHAKPELYYYRVDIRCKTRSGSIDPELVVAGGGKGGHKKKGKRGGGEDQRIVTVTLKVVGDTVTAHPDPATIHNGDEVQWTADKGEVRKIKFLPTSQKKNNKQNDKDVSDPMCSNRKCQMTAGGLTEGLSYVYTATVYDGREKFADPELVVAGGGPGLPHRRVTKN